MKLIVSLVTGIIFGLGLALSQMIDPAKVVNFLDVFGTWDPSLAFVMIGALAVNIVAYFITSKRKQPVLKSEVFHKTTKTKLDKKLMIGAALFGVGWGIAGYCPGPVLTSLSFGNESVWIMLMAYTIGTFATKVIQHQVVVRRAIAKDEACVG